MKYTTVKISSIITSIGKSKKVKGGTMTENIIYCNLPEDGISEKQANKWIEENNKRMTAICNFMNENNL